MQPSTGPGPFTGVRIGYPDPPAVASRTCTDAAYRARVLTAQTLPLSPSGKRVLRYVAIAAALIGTLLGLEAFVLHLTTDPFADTRLYYDAATRLNDGLPLYIPSTTVGVGPYVSPPFLAILFRPLALLPFPVAAVIWQAIITGGLVVTIRRIGIREPVLIALGCLALPLLWALSIGQAELLVLLMMTLGTPASVAFAGGLKLFPVLVAVYWVGRRDWQALARLAVCILGIGMFQLVLAPEATITYLRLGWLTGAFDFRIISPFAIHPLLWLVMVVALTAMAFRFAPTRYGWAFAVALSVLATPRLLTYQLLTLLAAFGGPDTSLSVAQGRASPETSSHG